MSTTTKSVLSISQNRISEILDDYRIACESRAASLLGRKEVFRGKAKFGIFGDGKEIPQIVLARSFRKGDFRAGYYRDQTLMMAIGELTLQQYFAQLYAHPDHHADPSSGGRSMTAHFATRMLDENGKLRDLTTTKNSSADVSPTASQMPRLLGLAYASKLFRQNQELSFYTNLSQGGNEIAIGTIGDAATSEGIFYETINAAGVLQVPILLSVWDDGYGISVPKKYQTTKGSISEILAGFQRTKTHPGIELFTVRGWDYQALCETYAQAEKICRHDHVPVVVHVTEITQPQGHSTSGSHQRYKTKERLQWEYEYDCIKKMREWICEHEVALPEQLDLIEIEAKKTAQKCADESWNYFMENILDEQNQLLDIIYEASSEVPSISNIASTLENTINPLRLDNEKAAHQALCRLTTSSSPARKKLIQWMSDQKKQNKQRYHSHLYSESKWSSLKIQPVKPSYSKDSPTLEGYKIVRNCFDAALARDPRVIAFGEDVGFMGGVNQGFAGLQKKYGTWRVMDTGIRECTIIGQGIGLALRGLRPIAEIQYLDYLLYGLQIMSDDIACLQYRTKGGQKNPVIIRTRGHRLEGIWHAGSPLGTILNALRGILVLTPRNMTQAAGFYNTVLASDDPALIIECLNGYRLKEKLPDNIDQFKVAIGVPEILKEGTDVTVVTYGSMCRVVMAAALELEKMGIFCEVVDVQTILPFDIYHTIVKSLQKTGRLVVADEDVPGGASAYILQQILETQNGYFYLDSKPLTITAQEHRPAYGSDGDYFSKPNPESVYDHIYGLMSESNPQRFPSMYI